MTANNMDAIISRYVKSLNEMSAQGKMYDKVFSVSNGRKYAKIISSSGDISNQNFAFCFIDRKTGEVYKPASWKSPATKHVRYTITNEEEAKNLAERSDSCGSFLYL